MSYYEYSLFEQIMMAVIPALIYFIVLYIITRKK